MSANAPEQIEAHHKRSDRTSDVPACWNPPNRNELDLVVGVPRPVPDYIPNTELTNVFTAINLRFESGEHAINLLLTGEPGTGKTTQPRQYAAQHGRPLFIFDCGAVRQVSDWWGAREIDGYRPSALVHALSIGGTVVVLDEVNRTPSHLLNPLLPLLDWRRETVTPTGMHVRVGPGTLIVGTANPGDGYAGTFAMDEALYDRFRDGIVPMRPLSDSQIVRLLVGRCHCNRAEAEMLARIRIEVNRAVPGAVGLRSLIAAGHWLRAGLKLREACNLTILNAYAHAGEKGSKYQRIDVLLRGLLNG